ncbi:HAD family hydrolase [Alteromonas sediminis]|uniref:HAD family hydrolase n=1 Tax=Alteromonas sediminis TaxID=2259342 RepID=A0A3N5XWT0_9ALTE|nr:HAD-IA family hydrolase [Alteromonas sediminis]RPJ65357.1 HAD family hydrolase [Alteromonas sediminis]
MKFYRPITKIKAISFDLDDTLYDNHPVIMRAEQGLQTYLNQHYPHAANLGKEAQGAIKQHLIKQDKRLASDMGELRRQTLRAMLSSSTLSDAEIEDAVTGCFNLFYRLRSDVKINKTVYSCLSRLKEIVPIVAITNGNIDTQVTGFDDYFEFTLHASLAFPRKPYPDMFLEAARRLNCQPEEILHVGDGLINDVYGAYKAGFQTAWLAVNRPMLLNNEPTIVLPHVQLDTLNELITLMT